MKAHFQSYNLLLRTCTPKFEVSILYGCEDIFNKNLERKKKEQLQGRTNRRMSIFNPTFQLVVVNLYTKFDVSILYCCEDIFYKNLERKKKEQIYRKTNRRMPICNPTIQLVIANLFDQKSGGRKKKKYREEQIGEGPFSIPQYNLS